VAILQFSLSQFEISKSLLNVYSEQTLSSNELKGSVELVHPEIYTSSLILKYRPMPPIRRVRYVCNSANKWSIRQLPIFRHFSGPFDILSTFCGVIGPISSMSSVPPTAESWLAQVLPPELLKHPISHRPPYQHHKDHMGELEPILRALSGTIPFGGLTKLSLATNIRDSTLSSWKKKLEFDQ
jgi:hypothetical protein